jgi:ribonuclease HI
VRTEFGNVSPPNTERIQEIGSIRITTDSQYVQKGITEWITSWEKNGWKTSGKKPVKNQDLWKRLSMLSRRYSITWDWVRGHAGNTLNEICDALVQTVIKRSRF